MFISTMSVHVQFDSTIYYCIVSLNNASTVRLETFESQPSNRYLRPFERPLGLVGRALDPR